MQTVAELDEFYHRADPWDYENNPDDRERKRKLLSLLPSGELNRTLDIGCGDGFITFDLPGKSVVGVDLSTRAIEFAKQRASVREDGDRFEYYAMSLFNLSKKDLGSFNLIVITGVLYKQYIGSSSALVNLIIDDLLEPGGYLVSCHINEWLMSSFPYNRVDASLYNYRGYTHKLEVYKK